MSIAIWCYGSIKSCSRVNIVTDLNFGFFFKGTYQQINLNLK